MNNATVARQFGHSKEYTRRPEKSDSLGMDSFPVSPKPFDPPGTVHKDTNLAIDAVVSEGFDLGGLD